MRIVQWLIRCKSAANYHSITSWQQLSFIAWQLLVIVNIITHYCTVQTESIEPVASLITSLVLACCAYCVFVGVQKKIENIAKKMPDSAVVCSSVLFMFMYTMYDVYFTLICRTIEKKEKRKLS